MPLQTRWREWYRIASVMMTGDERLAVLSATSHQYLQTRLHRICGLRQTFDVSSWRVTRIERDVSEYLARKALPSSTVR